MTMVLVNCLTSSRTEPYVQGLARTYCANEIWLLQQRQVWKKHVWYKHRLFWIKQCTHTSRNISRTLQHYSSQWSIRSFQHVNDLCTSPSERSSVSCWQGLDINIWESASVVWLRQDGDHQLGTSVLVKRSYVLLSVFLSLFVETRLASSSPALIKNGKAESNYMVTHAACSAVPSFLGVPPT